MRAIAKERDDLIHEIVTRFEEVAIGERMKTYSPVQIAYKIARAMKRTNHSTNSTSTSTD